MVVKHSRKICRFYSFCAFVLQRKLVHFVAVLGDAARVPSPNILLLEVRICGCPLSNFIEIIQQILVVHLANHRVKHGAHCSRGGLCFSLKTGNSFYQTIFFELRLIFIDKQNPFYQMALIIGVFCV